MLKKASLDTPVFDDIKFLIVFAIRYAGKTSKLFAFDQSTENTLTPSESGHMYLESTL